jgi:prepilin-type N-terminal cleavage/methylation domain-containing protein
MPHPRDESGYTLTELSAVLAILLTVLTALTTLFASGAKAELDANRRFQAQQEARMAVDRMRREIHCASAVALNPADSTVVAGQTVYRKITVTLPGHCPTAGGAEATIVYDTAAGAAGRYRLRRAGTRIADYVTTSHVFGYLPPSTSTRGRLTVDLPVNVSPSEGWKTWRLTSDIVLRNTLRE